MMIRLRAPAKLNLYLHVLGRRPDGYHEIETVFERLDLADELTFEPAQNISLTCDEPSLSLGDENLVIRAARALQQATGTTAGARIQLTKRIPIAAGLGGGSSDAAATLLGLSDLWNLRVARLRLLELAAGLGSDVPFFLHEATFAIGRERGNRCEPVHAPRPRLWHVLVAPEARLSTRDVYAAWDDARRDESLSAPRASGQAGAQTDLTAPTSSITMTLHALRNGSLGELATGLCNDLAPVAIRRCPVIQDLLSALRQHGCVGVSMSGSGPAVFGLCRDRAHAHQIAQHVRAAGSSWTVLVAATAQRSPDTSSRRGANGQ